MQWLKQKTTWAAIALIASALLPAFHFGWYTPEIQSAVQITIAGLAAIFMRQAVQGVQNVQDNNPNNAK